MPSIIRTIEVSNISPEEMAAIFAAWGGKEQAEFFGAVAREADGWPYGRSGFCSQALYIAEALDGDGRYVIERIADHAGLLAEQVQG